MRRPKQCPNCGEEVVAISIGWKCKGCKGVIDMQGNFHEHEERPFMPPMTNADRIRAMTDEELAELLANETYRIAKPCFDAFGYGLEKQIIYVKRLSWLQQPAEEG